MELKTLKPYPLERLMLEIQVKDKWYSIEELLKAEQKNTLRQIVEWAEESCTEHATTGGGNNRLRKECPRCWQEMKKQAGL